jgi:hypothetical protein
VSKLPLLPGVAAAFTSAALATGTTQPASKCYAIAGARFFKQGVNLSVEKGGVLQGPVNPEDYPQVQTPWEGTEGEPIARRNVQ